MSRMVTWRISFSSVALFVLLSAAAHAEIGWDPERTWVFAVGILEWEHEEIYASFPDAMPNRADRRLVKVLEAAGVPDDHVVFLADEEATLASIRQRFKRQLDRTDKGDLLIVYFAGHGSRDRKTGQTYFANYDAGESYASHWPVKEIFSTVLDRFSGDEVIFMADCCHSGALHDEAAKHRDDLACACLTSSYSHNSSTGNWTFTESLIAGFQGSPLVDTDADGEVELRELATYTEEAMAYVEHQKAMFIATDDFDADMAIADTDGEPEDGLGRRVEVEWKGSWYPAQVIDVDGGSSQVHYLGYDDTWNEWVGEDRLRKPRVTTFANGTRVNVLWPKDKTWYRGTVLASQFGMHKVHYDGYSTEWDEWVPTSAVKELKD